MKYKRNSFKRRILFLGLLMFLLCLSIGYAYLSQTLKLNTAASIAKTVWDVHFENVRVLEGSVGSTVPVINSDKTSVSLQVSLSTPGDFYAYYVDIVNNGTIHAKVDSLVKSNLTNTQSKYLEYTVTYADGVEINKNDSLQVGKRDTLKVVVRFKEMLNPSDLPNEAENLNLENQVVYVQDIGEGVERKRGLFYVLESEARSDENISFGAISSDTNGKGVYKLTKIETKTPIYYYRGDVQNNNVLFGNFCWKMIRTTEEGGVKLIYNGMPNSGVCDATGDATGIGLSVYHSVADEAKYVGYMYDNNTKNSTVKNFIDEWFKNNMVDYLDYLEDTPFYNERDFIEGPNFPNAFAPRIRIWGKGDSYASYMENVPNTTIKLGATNKEDIFTVSSKIGNGALTYPVGLITSDEAVLAGGRGYAGDQDLGWNANYYLCTNSSYWTMSPMWFYGESRVIGVFPGGDIFAHVRLVEEIGVRPVIALQKGSLYTKGDGTKGAPYHIFLK